MSTGPLSLLRLLLVWLLLFAAPVHADHLIMIRVSQAFPEAMNTLQQAIKKQGYAISRVQRVDVGLTKSGYKTAEYRLVFFGKHDEMLKLPTRYPELIPYLPLKFTIFAERNETILLTLNPAVLASFFSIPELEKQSAAWEKDVRAIFDRVREEK